MFSQTSFVYFLKEVQYKAFTLLYLLNLIVLYLYIFLTSQTSSEDDSSENEWLGFLSLGAKEAG